MTDQVRPIYRKIKNWQIKRKLRRHHIALLRRLKAAGGPSKIVFLCYGNICRSPLAAALAEQRLSGVTIDSAGFHEQTGRSCPKKFCGSELASGSISPVIALRALRVISWQTPTW